MANDWLKDNITATHFGWLICQSPAANDWQGSDLGGGAGNPGYFDYENQTRDTTYIFIKKSNRTQDVESYSWMMEPFPDGEGFKMTVGVESGGYTVTGIVESDAEMEGIKDFCKRCNRDGAEDIFLIHRRSSTDYEKFYKPDFTEVKYSPGVIKRRSLVWQKIDTSVHYVSLTFWIVWEA